MTRGAQAVERRGVSPHAEIGVEMLEKANADLEPELLTHGDAKELLATYSRAARLAAYGIAALSRRIADAGAVAKLTGSSMGRAKAVLQTGEAMAASDDLARALERGVVSLDQATEIASAEVSSPGAAKELIGIAQEKSFQVLRDRARAAKLEAEQHRDLADRQRAARSARTHTDDLGMVHIHLSLQPHVATPLVTRAETQARRLARAARAATGCRPGKGRTGGGGGDPEPFERYLADAYAEMLAGSGIAPGKRPELVVLVSQEVAERGWNEVRAGEVCKIPGVGPISCEDAKAIATRAFLNAVVSDGVDLRHFKRWNRATSKEIEIALELGEPPRFDGVRCVDCGNRFRPENDHVEPVSAGGPTSVGNNEWRCHPCHLAKTARDRAARKHGPGQPGTGPFAGTDEERQIRGP